MDTQKATVLSLTHFKLIHSSHPRLAVYIAHGIQGYKRWVFPFLPVVPVTDLGWRQNLREI